MKFYLPLIFVLCLQLLAVKADELRNQALRDCSLMAQTNNFRVFMGKRPLRIDTALWVASIKHNAYMGEIHKVTHTGRGHTSVSARAHVEGSSAGGEICLRSGSENPCSAVQMWANSKGENSHREIMLKDMW